MLPWKAREENHGQGGQDLLCWMWRFLEAGTSLGSNLSQPKQSGDLPPVTLIPSSNQRSVFRNTAHTKGMPWSLLRCPPFRTELTEAHPLSLVWRSLMLRALVLASLPGKPRYHPLVSCSWSQVKAVN